MATNTIYIDTNNQNELFLFETTEGSTPSLRVYVYEDGEAVSWSADNTSKFNYAVNREATEIVEVDGTMSAGTNYIDFEFTAAKTAINGKFFSSIIVYDVGEGEIIVQSDGMTTLKRNPALDGATILDTTTTINWGLYTNLPPFPWAIGNDIITVECADSPYDVLVSNASKSHVHDSDCDFIFNLPKATTDNIGKCYGFINTKLNFTITLQCEAGDTIDDSVDGGTKSSVRGYALPSSVMIRQLTDSKYITIWGDGAFDTDA